MFGILIIRALISQAHVSLIITIGLKKSQQVHRGACQDFSYHTSIRSRLMNKNEAIIQKLKWDVRKDFILFIYLFIFIIDYTITVFPIFSPLSILHPSPPTLQHSSLLSSRPWVVHISSLSPLFPKPFFISPYFMPTNYASSSLNLPPLFLSHSPLNTFRMMSISLILFLFLLFA